MLKSCFSLTCILIQLHLLLTIQVIQAQETYKPETTAESHYFKETYFLKDESQSCPDITDSQTGTWIWIKFCSLSASKFYGESSTLSFWGWREGQMKVNIYYPQSGNTSLLYTTEISVINSQVKFFHQDFNIAEEYPYANDTRLEFYYMLYDATSGSGELSLRDVWFRPTTVDDGDQPPFWCNSTGLIVAAVMTAISAFSIPFICFIMGSACRLSLTYVFKFYWLVLEWLSLCTMISGAILIPYFNGYPAMRCKNDAAFVASLVMFCLGVSTSFLLYLRINRSLTVAPAPVAESETKESGIKMTTVASSTVKEESVEAQKEQQNVVSVDVQDVVSIGVQDVVSVDVQDVVSIGVQDVVSVDAQDSEDGVLTAVVVVASPTGVEEEDSSPDFESGDDAVFTIESIQISQP